MAISILPLSLSAQDGDATLPEEPTWRPRPPASNAELRARYPDAAMDGAATSPGFTPAPLAVEAGGISSPGMNLLREPLPPFPVTPETEDLGVPSEDGRFLPRFEEVRSWFQVEGLRARVGPLQVRLALDLNSGYNDNIFSANTGQVGDIVTTASPTIEVGLGEFPRIRSVEPVDEDKNVFFLRYTPSFQFFAQNSGQNTTNENLLVQGRYNFRRLRAEGAFTYTRTSDPQPTDVGRQEYSVYALAVNLNYALTARVFSQVGLNNSYQTYEQGLDFNTASASVALGYEVGPKLRLTLGPYFGLTTVEGGQEQPFQGVNLGFTYDSQRKLAFRGTVGAQAQQYTGNNPNQNEDSLNPVFALGGTYRLRPSQTLTFDLNRSFSNANNGQSYIGTTAILGYEQLFLRKVQFNLGVNYQILEYQGFDERTDTYVNFSARVGYLFWDNRVSTYVAYNRAQRLSDISTFEYVSNFLGAGVNVQF